MPEPIEHAHNHTAHAGASDPSVWAFFSRLFGTDFVPRGDCVAWRPEIVWLHVASDALIAASCQPPACSDRPAPRYHASMTNEVDTPQVEPKPTPQRSARKRTRPSATARTESVPTPTSPAPISPEADPSVVKPAAMLDVSEPAHPHAPAIEAVLLSVDRPVSAVRLAEALGLLDEAAADAMEAAGDAAPAGRKRGKSGPESPVAIVRAAVTHLNQQYTATGRSFRIESVAGGYRLMTLAKFAGVIEDFLGKRERTSLSRAAIETLAIVAYKQPLTRASLEAIRGVACGEVLKTLMERRLVTITGRAEELGRPMLYGTTKQFLEAFGLASLKDLPSAAEFKARHAGGESEGND
jgi:segregation and condensation protein B